MGIWMNYLEVAVSQALEPFSAPSGKEVGGLLTSDEKWDGQSWGS
jgi:hypothetical protein